MLRASIEYNGTEADVAGIAEGAKAGDAGIEHGALLTTFADAAVQGDAAQLATARDALREAAGSAVVVDAAGVIGNFERMVRIADCTGIPLDNMVQAMAGDLQQDLGLDAFESRRGTSRAGIARALGPAVRGALRLGLRLAGRRGRPG